MLLGISFLTQPCLVGVFLNPFLINHVTYEFFRLNSKGALLRLTFAQVPWRFLPCLSHVDFLYSLCDHIMYIDFHGCFNKCRNDIIGKLLVCGVDVIPAKCHHIVTQKKICDNDKISLLLAFLTQRILLVP